MAIIASQYGFTPDKLWNAAENSQLRQQRARWAIVPGDIVQIPDQQPKELNLKTGSLSRYVVAREVCLTVRFSPEDTSSADFDFLLASTDGTYSQQRKLASDLVHDRDGDDLHFCGLRPRGRYTLRCGPAGHQPSITVFEDVPYQDLVKPLVPATWEQPARAASPAEEDPYPDRSDSEEAAG